MIVAAIPAVVSVTGAGVAPPLLARVGIAPAAAPDLDVSIDPTAMQAALPRSLPPGRAQVVGLAVYLDGEALQLSARRPAAEISLSTSPRNRWSLSLPHPGALGQPVSYLGAQPGRRRIDLRGLYLTPAGVVEVPLVTNGKVDNVEISQAPDGTWTEQVTGLDASARFDHRRVDLALGVGHGETLGAVARSLAEAAGVPAYTFDDGPVLQKPISVVNSDVFSALSDAMAAFGRSLYIDRAGEFVNPVTEYVSGERVDLVLRDRDIVLGSTRAQVKGDVFTRITLTGSIPVPQDDSLRVTVSRTVDLGDYSPKTAAYVQAGDGSLTALGTAAPAAFLTKLSQTETRRTYRGETLLYEEIREWGWWNPEVARYTPDGDGTTLLPLSGFPYGVYLYAGAAAGDQQPAYHLQQEIFALLNHSQQAFIYDRGLGSGDTGRLLRAETVKDVPSFRGAATKHRTSTGTSWESVGLRPGVLLLGSGRGVDNGGATPGLESLPVNCDASGNTPFAGIIIPKERVTLTYEPTPDGKYTVQQATSTETFAPPAAGAPLYLFASQSAQASATGAAALEVLGETSRETISYSAAGESGHSETTVRTVNGALVSSEIRDGLDGYLPRAETDSPAASGVSQSQSQPMEAVYVSYALEAVQDRAEDSASSTWEEAPEQLAASAKRKILDDAAWTVEVSAPINYYVDPLWRVALELGCVDLLGYGAGVPILLRKLVIVHTIPESGPALTKITGRHYAVTS